MAVTLDGVANFIVPLGVFIFIFTVMFWKLKEPLSDFFNWVTAMFINQKERMDNNVVEYETIVYT